MKTVNINYQRLSNPEYVDKIEFIHFSLDNNDNFPNLAVALSVIQDKKGILVNQMNKAHAGDHQAVKEVAASRKSIDKDIKKNGNYINDTANGDEVKLLSSGYDLSKDRELKEKEDVRVVATNDPNVGKAHIKVIDGAVSYLIEIADEPSDPNDTPVYHRLPLTTKTYFLVNNIVKHKPYLMLYVAATTKGESETKGPFQFFME